MEHPVETHALPPRDIILVCSKCARKLDGEGYGRKRKESLKTILRQGLKALGHRQTFRIIETKCLGICPKGATTIIVAKKPGQALVFPAGTTEEAAAARVLDCG